MTHDAARRNQSSEAKGNGGKVAKGSWASKAQSSAAKNANAGIKFKLVLNFRKGL